MGKESTLESCYLQTLVEVARTGNLTKAADTLCVTQSAISRRIKFLETQYDCELFDRSGPVLTLSPKGLLVKEKAEKILEIEKEMQVELRLPDKNEGISFACTPTFGIVHLPQIMRKFMLVCPENNNLKFTLKAPKQIVSGLKDGLYDTAVIEHCPCFDLSEFEMIPIPGDEMVFAAAPALGFGEELLSLDTLFQQTLYSRPEGWCSRVLLEENLSKQGHTLQDFKRIVLYDDLRVIIQALIDGLGIGFISSELATEYVKRGQLKIYKGFGFNHERKRTLVSNGCGASHCAATGFTEILEAYFSNL